MAGKIKKSDIIDEKAVVKALKATAKSFRDAEKDLVSLTSATQNFDTETKKFSGSQKELTASQKKLAASTSKLTEIERNQIQAKANLQRSIKKEIDEARQLAIINDKQAGTLEKLIAKNKLLEIQKRKLTSTGKKLRTETKAYNKQIDANNKVIKANRGQSQGLTNNLKTLGKQFLAITGLAAAGMIAIRKLGQIFKTAAEDVREFEDTFTTVLTLLDEAQKLQFEQILSVGVVDLMAKYGLKIADVNQALFDTISNGIEVGNSLGFLDKSARLAIAGNAELSSVVKGATKVYEVYKDEVSDVDEILNSFFAAQVKGATNVEFLASNIGKIAATAHKAKIPVNVLFGTFAGLTKFLDGTEESATVLVNVINALINATPAAQEEFERFGIQVGLTAIQNNGLLETILQIIDATKDNEDAITKLIPNIRAFKGMAGLTATAVAEINKNILALNDTEAASILVQGAFNEKMETSKRESEKLKTSWQRLMIELGGGESIFRKVGGAIRSGITFVFDHATKSTRAFRVAIAGVFDILRKEENKKAQKILDEYRGISDEIVEIAEETTTELTEEEKKRQRELQIIKNEAADAQEKREKAAIISREKTSLAQRKVLAQHAENVLKDIKITGIENVNTTILDIMMGNYITEQELAKDNAEIIKDIELEIAKETRDEKLEILEDLANKSQMLSNAGTDLIVTLFARQSEKLEQEKKAQLKIAGDNEVLKEQIEEKFEKKQNEIRKRQAIADKLNALFGIGVNTALGIAKALPDLILAAFVGTLGALQAATVAATPIPQFWKGIKGFSGGEAEVGERGREIINTPGGSFLSPDRRTKMYLPPGTDVIPNPETEKRLEKGTELKELAASNRQMARSLENRPEIHNNITSGGIKYMIKKGHSTTEYMDKYIR